MRELELSDLDALFSMYAEPGMTDYMEGLYEYEEELEYQKAYIENMYRFYGYGMWLVFEKKTGTLIGRAGVEHREELNGDMELGYAIKFFRMLCLILTAAFGLGGFIVGSLLIVAALFLNPVLNGRGYLFPLFPFDGLQLLRRLFRVALPYVENKTKTGLK